MAQRWKGRVRWHTDASFDYDQAALDVDALDEELDEEGGERGCGELLGRERGLSAPREPTKNERLRPTPRPMHKFCA